MPFIYMPLLFMPLQYEVMSLSSVNAEGQERLFSQAKRISLRATNRKTENVLPTILLAYKHDKKNGNIQISSSSIREQKLKKVS